MKERLVKGLVGAQIFPFSVLDEEKEVIEKMKEYQGRYVKLTYVERYATLLLLGRHKILHHGSISREFTTR